MTRFQRLSIFLLPVVGIGGSASVLAEAAEHEVGIAPIVDAGYIFQFLLALGLVIAGIFALMYLLRKLNHLPGKGTSAIQVVGGIPLGAREKLVLVQVGETQLLVGMAPGQLRTLHVFDKPVVEPASSGNGGAGFAAVLGSLAPRGKKP